MLKILKPIGYALLLILAVPLGVVGAVAAFFAAAFITSSVALLVVAGALALVVITGGMAMLASRGLIRRERPLRRWLPAAVTGGTLLAVGLLASALVFEPMDVAYVPLEATEDTRYWDLPTGSRLAYLHVPAEGTPRETPVVVLHGGPGAPSPLVPARADELLAAVGFDVYHYHQVGAGLSERLDDVTEYTVGRHVADLEAVRQQLGAERLILIGGSWGGTLAAHYLAAYPDQVEKAVFVSPGAIWSPAWSEAGWGSDGPEVEILMEAITPRFGVVYYLQGINPRAARNLASDQEMSGFFQSLIGKVIAQDIVGCELDEDANASKLEPVIPRGFSYYANMFTAASMDLTDDPRPALRELDTPVLILRGECDRIRPEVTQEYRNVFANSILLVVDGAGHSVAASPLYADILHAFVLGEPLPLESQVW